MEGYSKHRKHAVEESDRIIAKAAKLLAGRERTHRSHYMLIRENNSNRGVVPAYQQFLKEQMGSCGREFLLGKLEGDSVYAICSDNPHTGEKPCGPERFLLSPIEAGIELSIQPPIAT